MDIRFYIDPETGEPHILRHGVSEREVAEVLEQVLAERVGREGSRIAVGRTRSGRYLRIIYAPDPAAGSIFVVTAYELGPRALWALRRRRRKKK